VAFEKEVLAFVKGVLVTNMLMSIFMRTLDFGISMRVLMSMLDFR
jgi:hypothetical protein